MGKRGAIFVLMAFLCSIGAVQALHTPSVIVAPLSLYETRAANFTITITNGLLSLNTINDVTIDTQGFNILSAVDITDWQKAITGNDIRYNSSKAGISNWATQNFGIEAKAPKVDADQQHDWNIVTKDRSSGVETTVIQITIINDNTPVVLTGPLPYNGMLIKEGTSDQQARINATDPETGVKQVNFNWADCDMLNESHTLVLSAAGDVYSGTVDLSNYEDSTDVCFSFNAENNGGDASYYSGTLTIDGKAPTVNLIAPPSGSTMNMQSQFEFNATDNLAPTLICNLLVDGNVEAVVSSNNSQITAVSVDNIPEGKHEWKVECIDLVGWIGESDEWDYTLDRTPPNITLENPDNGAIIANGTAVDIEVTDNFGLDTVSYELILGGASQGVIDSNSSSISFDTADWPDGQNMVIVTAYDKAGNRAEEAFVFIIDRFPPTIALIGPEDGNKSDVHVAFRFDATDTYDEMLDCELYVDDSISGVAVVNGSLPENVIDSTLPLGNHSWRIHCTDDAGHEGISDSRGVEIVDLSGPDVAIEPIGMIIRGNSISIRANITDISGVREAHAVITLPDGTEENITLDKSGDVYSAAYVTTVDSQVGNYTVTIHATDRPGNENSASEDFGVTYSYIVSLSLDPTTAIVKKNVDASGTVKYDNGSDVADGEIIILWYQHNTTADVNNGEFSANFTAPASTGTYDVVASITAPNGLIFSDTEQLKVKKKPTGGDDDDDDHGPGPIADDCGNGVCNVYEDCASCSEDCGACAVPNETEVLEEPNGPGEISECEKDSDCGNGKQCNNGKCVGQHKEEGNATEPEPEMPVIGEATGFFSLDRLKSSGLLWILLLLALILLTMALVSRGKKKDSLGLESYIEDRRRII